jgi:hypothetical protein
MVYVCVPLAMFVVLVAVEAPLRLLGRWVRAVVQHLKVAWLLKQQVKAAGAVAGGDEEAQPYATTTEFQPGLTEYYIALRQQRWHQQHQHQHQHQHQRLMSSQADDIAPAGGITTLPGGHMVSRPAAAREPDRPTTLAAVPAAAMSHHQQQQQSQQMDSADASPAAIALRSGGTCFSHFPTPAWCGVLAMIILFFFFPSLARATLSLFVCVSLKGDPSADLDREFLWVIDTSQPCWGSAHSAYALGLGIPLLLTIFVCLPAAVACTLRWGRMKADQQWLGQHFSFLFEHFRPECYLWEVVVMLQTLILVIVSVFAHHMGAFYQALLLNACFSGIAATLLWFQPYITHSLQYVAVGAVGCELLTSYAAMSFIPFPLGGVSRASSRAVESELGNGYRVYKEVLGAVVLAVNVAFILGALLELLRALRRSPTADAVLAWLSSRVRPAWRQSAASSRAREARTLLAQQQVAYHQQGKQAVALPQGAPAGTVAVGAAAGGGDC